MNREQSGSIARRRRLNELLRVIGIECQEPIELSGISDRAQEVGENGLFVALQGQRADGRQWAQEVRQRGGFVLSDQPGERTFVHPDPRAAYSLLLQAYYDYPALRLTMIGVTGTNGKSTVTQLLYGMLSEAGRSCCLIGTGRIVIGDEIRSSPNTTPDPLTLVRLLDEACRRGIDTVIMEVSSQALAMHRVDGLLFDLAVLTNLKQDHLDYHKTLEAYQRAKFMLFEKLKEKGTAILNQDDPVTLRWLAQLHHPVFTYGEDSVNFRIRPVAETLDSITFDLNDHRVEAPLAGAFNMRNLSAALACGFALDLPWEGMLQFASHAALPPGRMEIVCRHPVLAVVDYAHTASAMEAMLKHWRRVADQRHSHLAVVFGCGGDREAQKRPLMGQIACAYADQVVLCDDNPRSEDPSRITAQIAAGCDGRQKIIHARPAAIKFVLDGAQTDDIIVVAGKGGETSLIQNTTMTCPSDRTIIERYFGEAGEERNMFLTLVSAFGISMVVVLAAMPLLISYLHKINYNQTVSEYSLEEYKQKQKTPTMGGIVFVLTPLAVTLVLQPSAINDLPTMIVMLAYVGYGLIGFLDDYIIVIRQNNEGLKPRYKFFLQLVLAVLFFFMYRQNASTDVILPFVEWVIPFGALYMVLVFFMFTGASNAVNLTDGMDGLAAGCSFLAFAPFVMFALQQSKLEIATLIMAVMGSLLGFLKYNAHPAKIFMGDTGSLALGGALAAVGMILKQEIAVVVIGGVFVWETLCVIIQISSVKLRGKRVFRYTPIHYSFVLGGMRETQVVLMFWILQLVCTVAGFLIGVL